MRNVNAIFIKQLQSLVKNPVMLVQAVMFVGIVMVMSFFINLANDDDYDCAYCIPAYICEQCLEDDASPYTPDPSLAGTFTVMFAGLTMISTASMLVTEDKTTGNLRFMTMAGVKPKQYLLGSIAGLFVLSVWVLVAFSLVGQYFGAYLLRFVSITAAGLLVSILLGVAIGLSKVPMLAFPFSLVLGLGPMLSGLNETLARGLRFVYTQQVSLAISSLGEDMSYNFFVIGINGFIVLIWFAWMHRKGELRW